MSRKKLKVLGKITRNRVRALFDASIESYNLNRVIYRADYLNEWDEEDKSFWRVVWESKDGLLCRLPFLDAGPRWYVIIAHDISPARSDALARDVAGFINQQ